MFSVFLILCLPISCKDLSCCLWHFLLLSAELREVDAYDFHTVEALVGVFVAYVLEVGRKLVDEQVQGFHLLVVAKLDMRRAEKEGTFVLGGKLVWQQIHLADDAERHLIVVFQCFQLAPFGRAMYINAVLTVPKVVHRNALAASVRYH